MKFSTRQDIEAPIDFVFHRATDFNGFERQALRRGVDIERADDRADIGTGMTWNAAFSFRGKHRKVRAELADYDPPNAMMIESNSGGVAAHFDVEFLPLSRNRTRIKVGLELAPKTMSARLLIQSLRFAKKSLNKRFAARIDQFRKDVENRHDAAAAGRVRG